MDLQAPRPSDSERRKEERVPADAPIELYGLDRKLLTLGPDLLDIHHRGLGLKLCDALEPGQILRFKIRLPSGPVQGQARVCWIRPRPVGYQCGLEIQSIGRLHAYRLEQFLNPGRFDLLKIGDVVLTVAVLAVTYLVVTRWLGLGLWGRP